MESLRKETELGVGSYEIPRILWSRMAEYPILTELIKECNRGVHG